MSMVLKVDEIDPDETDAPSWEFDPDTGLMHQRFPLGKLKPLNFATAEKKFNQQADLYKTFCMPMLR
jgi:hypothetical protein